MLSRAVPRWWCLPVSIAMVLGASCAGEDSAGRVRVGLQNQPTAGPSGGTTAATADPNGGGSNAKDPTPAPKPTPTPNPSGNPTPTAEAPPALVRSLTLAVDPTSPGLTLDAVSGNPIIYPSPGSPSRVQLKPIVEFETGDAATPSVRIWRSDKPTFAFVDASGSVTAGTLPDSLVSTSVAITAEYGGKAATMSVIVSRRGKLLAEIE